MPIFFPGGENGGKSKTRKQTLAKAKLPEYSCGFRNQEPRPGKYQPQWQSPGTQTAPMYNSSNGASVFAETASTNPERSLARPSSEGITLGIVPNRILSGFGSDPMNPSHSSVTTNVMRIQVALKLVACTSSSWDLYGLYRDMAAQLRGRCWLAPFLQDPSLQSDDIRERNQVGRVFSFSFIRHDEPKPYIIESRIHDKVKAT